MAPESAVRFKGSLFEGVEITEESAVEREACEASERRRDENGPVAAEIGIHRGGEEPELQHHDDRDHAEDSEDDHPPLGAGEARAVAQDGSPSTPTA